MKRHRALWYKRGLNDSCSICLVCWCFANIQTQVLLGQLTAVQQPFFLSGILLSRCRQQLGVTKRKNVLGDLKGLFDQSAK